MIQVTGSLTLARQIATPNHGGRMPKEVTPLDADAIAVLRRVRAGERLFHAGFMDILENGERPNSRRNYAYYFAESGEATEKERVPAELMSSLLSAWRLEHPPFQSTQASWVEVSLTDLGRQDLDKFEIPAG